MDQETKDPLLLTLCDVDIKQEPSVKTEEVDTLSIPNEWFVDVKSEPEADPDAGVKIEETDHPLGQEDTQQLSPKCYQSYHQCPLCNKMFRNRRDLYYHSHDLGKNSADIDSEATSCKVPIKAHIRFHAPRTKYGCTECGLTFKTKLEMDSHKSVHTDPEPYKCRKCKRTFRIQADRDRHVRYEHSEEVRCTKCQLLMPKGFLWKHMRTHPPLNCRHCKRRFGHLSDLTFHLVRKHSEVVGKGVVSKKESL